MGEREGESSWPHVARCVFWVERLVLFLLLTFYDNFPCCLLLELFSLFTSLFTASVRSSTASTKTISRLGEVLLFIVDRNTFFLASTYAESVYKGFGETIRWRLAVGLSVLVHTMYILQNYQKPLIETLNRRLKKLSGNSNKCGGCLCREEFILRRTRMAINLFCKTWHDLILLFRNIFFFVRELSRKSIGVTDSSNECRTLREELNRKLDWIREEFKEDQKGVREEMKSTALKINETCLLLQETVRRAEELNEKLRKLRDDQEEFRQLMEEIGVTSIELAVRTAEAESYRAVAGVLEAKRREWEEEKTAMVAELCAAKASSEMYKACMRDLGLTIS